MLINICKSKSDFHMLVILVKNRPELPQSDRFSRKSDEVKYSYSEENLPGLKIAGGVNVLSCLSIVHF